MRLFPASFALLAAVLFAGALRSDTPAAEWRDAPLAIRARRLELKSAATGRVYQIFIYVPDRPPPPAGYPVLHLLDGNSTYPVAASILQLAEHRTNPGGLTPGLLVGIGYPGDAPLDPVARTEDYTPPAEDLSQTGDNSGHKQGGADRFLAFLENELKPRLAAEFPIDASRQTLFGHSYGGLFTLHTLFTRPEAFQRYVAASPSIWWNSRHLLGEKDAWLKTRAATPDTPAPRLAITVGSLEQTASTDPRLAHRAGIVVARAQVDNARALSADLAAAGVPNELFVLEQNDHGAARVPALVHALRLAFGD